MRAIKFRAWDIDDKQFIYVHIGQDDVCISDGISTIEMPLHHSDFEQFTGIKDKNGKEIFEGDIVSEHNGDIIGEIVQNPSGEYRIAWLGIYGGESILYEHHSMCEVIGNIHENRELLEKNKDEE